MPETTTTTTLGKVKEGIDLIVQVAPEGFDMQVDAIFGNQPAKRQKYVTIDSVTKFGYADQTDENAAVDYDAYRKIYSTNWTMLNWTKGWKITKQAEYNDIYAIEAGKAADARQVLMETERKDGANIFNNGFTGTSGPDGGELFATDVGAGSGNPTYANTSATALALNATNLKTVRAAMRRMKDPRNRPLIFTGDLNLVVPPELEWTTDTLLASVNVPGNANNDANVVKRGLSKLVLDDLTSATRWFFVAKDKRKHGLFQAVGMPMGSMMQPDIDYLATKVVVFKQWVYGWVNGYGIWGENA
jgi:hypothetical protein